MPEYGIPRINDSNIEGFISDVGKGLEVQSAFWRNGINPSSGMEALAIGKVASAKTRPLKRELPMIRFWFAYSEALAGLHLKLISAIRSSEDWKAHKYVLETSAPDVYGPDAMDYNISNNLSLKD